MLILIDISQKMSTKEFSPLSLSLSLSRRLDRVKLILMIQLLQNLVSWLLFTFIISGEMEVPQGP